MPISNVNEELIKKCQRGDKQAFEQLYYEISRELYSWVFSLLRDHDSTEEVFQECMIRTFRHLPKLKEAAKFSYWLYRMAINQCNTYRSKYHSQRHLTLNESIKVDDRALMWLKPNPDTPRKVLLNKELLETINRAIGQLPTKQRLAITLFEVEGHSIKDIARMLNSSEGAVKFNIHQARNKLRQLLRPLVDKRYLGKEKNNK